MTWFGSRIVSDLFAERPARGGLVQESFCADRDDPQIGEPSDRLRSRVRPIDADRFLREPVL